MFSLRKFLPFLASSEQEVTDPELAHTLVELMSLVGYELYGDKYWKALDAQITAKRDPNYRAQVDAKNLPKAWELLKRKTWVSLQNITAGKKITTITPLAELPQIEELVLNGNLISDLQPIASLINLRRLDADQNKIRDLAPLQNCPELHALSLIANPIEDFSPLSKLTKLSRLSISSDQLNAFRSCAPLPTVEHLRVSGDEDCGSLFDLPEMPRLRTLRIESLQSLDGLGRFPELINLDVRGVFANIDTIASLRHLTEASFDTTRSLNATALEALYALRQLSFRCPTVVGVQSLERLPALHEISCRGGAENSPGLSELRKTLSSWGTEFLMSPARKEPSASLEIVTQTEFEYYDNHPYGIEPSDNNPGMLGSERGWILERVRAALAIDLEEDTDFVLPWQGDGRRSDTLVLYTLRAYDSFREIVRRVQTILGESKNDWIIYFQSCLWEGPDEVPTKPEDFIVWLYPDKIRATPDQAKIIEPLLGLK